MKTAVFAIAFIILTMGFASAEINESYVNEKLGNAIDLVNHNPDYLNFIKDSRYKSVRLDVEGNSYYFAYENNSVKRTDSLKENLKVTISYSDFEKLKGDKESFGYLLGKLPLGVKLNVFFQCIGTNWCRKKIF
jgi:hypothetical protein